jgi:hypothetical protein
MREFDRKFGPEDYYDRRLREKREAEEKRKVEERERQAREAREQQRAANISQERWDQIDERIRQSLQQYTELNFGEDSPTPVTFRQRSKPQSKRCAAKSQKCARSFGPRRANCRNGPRACP